MTRGSAGRGVWRNVLLLVISVAVSSVLLELGWRTYLYRTGRGFFDNPREFTSPWFTAWDEPQPYLTPTGFFYRNGQVAAVRPPNELRVIAFGGSTTVNQRAGISYPELLERRFAPDVDGFVVRVLNAGSEGFSTAHTLVNLSLRNLDTEPDVIIVYENINDLSASWFGTKPSSDYAAKYLTPFYLGFRHRTGVLAAIGRVSRLARFLFSQIAAIEYPAHQLNTQADCTQGLVYFRRNLQSILAIARANRIRVILVTQPAKANFRDHPGFAAFNQAIRDLAEAEGVDLIDLAATIVDDRLFLDDAIHNNREGVEAVAEALYPKLREVVNEVATHRGR